MSENSPLANLFLENKDAKFVFVQPGGNHGDLLIYFGLEVLAKKLQLNFRSLSAQEFLGQRVANDEVLYLQGGGGYNRWCSGMSLKLLEHALCSDTKLVIQGPCTIDQDIEYIQHRLVKALKLPRKSQLIFMARERTTFDLCEECLVDTGAEILLDQDTAFWADKKSLEMFAGLPRSKYRFYALREDNESLRKGIHDYGRGVQFDPAYFCKNFRHWVKVHLYAKEIITNRTHSSIIGSLLGKSVSLYPGSYHKNRSIWEYSLKNRGVLWGPDERRSDFSSQFHLTEQYLPTLFRNSYKVNQVVRWLQRVPLN